MLTPNEVRKRRREILAPKAPGIIEIPTPDIRQSQTLVLYAEVLREISQGSIDPKSLALAALGIEV